MKIRLVILGLSLLLYGLAQALPCLLFNIVARSGHEANAPTGALNAYGYPDNIFDMSGLELTIAGFLGLIFGQLLAIGWLANPLYWASCVLLLRQQDQIAAIAAVVAVGLGFAGTMLAFGWRLPNGSSPYTQLALAQLLPGFWVWLAAPAVVAIGAGCCPLKSRKQF